MTMHAVYDNKERKLSTGEYAINISVAMKVPAS